MNKYVSFAIKSRSLLSLDNDIDDQAHTIYAQVVLLRSTPFPSDMGPSVSLNAHSLTVTSPVQKTYIYVS